MLLLRRMWNSIVRAGGCRSMSRTLLGVAFFTCLPSVSAQDSDPPPAGYLGFPEIHGKEARQPFWWGQPPDASVALNAVLHEGAKLQTTHQVACSHLTGALGAPVAGTLQGVLFAFFFSALEPDLSARLDYRCQLAKVDGTEVWRCHFDRFKKNIPEPVGSLRLDFERKTMRLQAYSLECGNKKARR